MNYIVVTVTKKRFKEIRKGKSKDIFLYIELLGKSENAIIFKHFAKGNSGYKSLLPIPIKNIEVLRTNSGLFCGTIVEW